MSIVAFPLVEENKHVRELTRLLNRGGRGATSKGIAEVFNHVCSMERDLGKAMRELTAMRNELSVMREEQKHPIKTMLHKAADSLMSKLKSAYKQIVSLKDKFIGGCKQAVEDIKDKGIVMANNVVGALNIKGELEAIKVSANEAITSNEKKIANIEAAAAQYHSAGRAVKNIGLTLIGREPVPDIKPNGKLATLLQAPFRSEIRRLNRSIARTDKALVQIDKLEKAAERSAERNKSSVLDEMKQHKKTTRSVHEIATPKKLRTANQEL